VATAHDVFGRLDAVVNNAGVAPAGRIETMPLDEWQRILAVNVLAPVALMRAAAPVLLGQGRGKVVNIGSLSGMRGKPTLAAYSASKGALARLTEASAAEWAGRGVQVNMIAPGAFATEAQRAVIDDPDILARRVRKIPAGRMGRVEEIGPLACFLVSPLSDFVTGAIYTIDGGEVSKL
jgi:2-deoxy-D-gluconate 3-dehydrogenase